jgi:hypothetical protein
MNNKNKTCIAIKFMSESGFSPKFKYLNVIQTNNKKITIKGKWILSKPVRLDLE